MAVYPDSLEPHLLSDPRAKEAWRRVVQVGEGQVVILGAYRPLAGENAPDQVEASVTVTSYCCPRCLPVSSAVIWQESGPGAMEHLRALMA